MDKRNLEILYSLYRELLKEDFGEGVCQCFDSVHIVMKDENRELLEFFSDLTYRDIYKEEIKDITDSYLNLKLVEFKDNNKVCVSKGFSYILFDFLTFNLQDDIRKYIEMIKYLESDSSSQTKRKTSNDNILIKSEIYKNSLEDKFGELKDCYLVSKFLPNRDLVRGWYSQFEINLQGIEKVLETVKHYDFSKVRY